MSGGVQELSQEVQGLRDQLSQAQARVRKRDAEIMALEDLTKAIFNQAGKAIVVCDQRYRIIRASQTAHALAGKSPLGLYFQDAFPLQILSAASPRQDENVSLPFSLQTTLARGTATIDDTMLYQDDGRIYYLQVTARPLHAGDDQPEGCLVTMTDLTAQREAEESLGREQERQRRLVASEIAAREQAEQALRQANKKLEGLFQASPLPIIALDTGGRVELWNRAAEKLFGWRAEEVLGQPIPSVPPEKWPELRDLLRQTNELAGLETQRYTRDGALVEVSLHSAQVHNDEGKITNSIGILENITGRKQMAAEQQRLLKTVQNQAEELQVANEELITQAEELQTQVAELNYQAGELAAQRDELKRLAGALAFQKRLLEEVIDQMPAGVILADCPSGQVIAANRELERILGHGFRVPADIARYNWCEGFHPDGRPYRFEEWPLTRALTTGEVVRDEEIAIFRADGTRRTISVSAAPVRNREDIIRGGVAIFQDITERRAVAAEIRRLASFPRFNPNPVLEIDATGAITFCNQAAVAALRALGAVGGPEAFFPEDLEDILSTALGPGAGPWYREVRIGEMVFAEDISFAEPFGVFRIYARDITARRRAEAEQARLLAERDRTASHLEAVLNTISEELIISDLEGNILTMNRAALTRRGFEDMAEARRHVSEHQRFFEIRDFSDRVLPVEEWPLGRALRGETFTGMELHHRRLDTGEERLCSYSGAPVLDRLNQPVLVVISVRDITQRKQAETALKESEERYRSIFHNSHAVMLLVDPGTGAIVDANPAACSYYGYTQEALTAMAVTDINQLGPEQVVAEMQKARSGECRQFLFRHKLASGAVRPVEVFSGPVRFHGKTLLYSIVHDVSARQQAEEALRESGARLRAVFENLDAGVVFASLDGHLFDWNPAALAMHGFGSLEECRCFLPEFAEIFELSTLAGDLLPLDHWPLSRVLRGEQLCDLELRVRRLNTDWQRILSYSGSLVRDPDGSPLLAVISVTDITARKQGEEALRQERDFVTALLQTVGALVVVLDCEGRIIRFNQACEQNTGFSFQEVAGKPFFDLFLLPEELPDFKQAFNSVSAENFPNSHVNHWVTRDGEPRLISWSNSALTDEQGRVTYIIGTGIDITERQRAEAALKQAYDELERRVQERTAELQRQGELIQDLYNQAPCGYHSLDAAGTFVQINDTELAWLGYTRAEVVGRLKFPDILTAASRKTFQATFPGFKASGEVRDLEYELVRKDGSIIPVLLSSSAITDASGNFVMGRSTVFDMTARRQAEAALEAEHQRLLSVLERIPAYVALISPECTIPYANREFVKRFGDPGNRLCYEFLFGIDAPCTRCKALEVLKNNTPEIWEWTGPDHITYQIYDYPFIDADGSPLILEMGVDISRRKQAEKALRESEERLRSLSVQLINAQETERQRLSLELHDDLGQLLTVLKMQLRGTLKKLPPELRGSRDALADALAFINSIVDAVRRLSRNLRPPLLEDVGLVEALKQLCSEFQKYNQFTCILNVDDIQDRFTVESQILIYRIFQESLNNIAKHAGATQVTISIKNENGHVSFRVKDNGSGFNVAEVWGGDPTKRGLGLSAMYERIRMLGGDLAIDSQRGQGTKIAFTVPSHQA
jgi:PAS domain S-box-containing protein